MGSGRCGAPVTSSDTSVSADAAAQRIGGAVTRCLRDNLLAGFAHPNIVKYRDSFLEQGVLNIVRRPLLVACPADLAPPDAM